MNQPFTSPVFLRFRETSNTGSFDSFEAFNLVSKFL